MLSYCSNLNKVDAYRTEARGLHTHDCMQFNSILQRIEFLPLGMVPIDSCIGILGPQLVELLEENGEVWPYWKRYVTGYGLRFDKTLNLLSLCSASRCELLAALVTLPWF